MLHHALSLAIAVSHIISKLMVTQCAQCMVAVLLEVVTTSAVHTDRSGCHPFVTLRRAL